ncbi:hypothetical protein QZH41_014125, partial [Actinostola sp. cb2023]
SRLQTNKRLSECPRDHLLQFKDRYLEWLWILKRQHEGETVKEIKADDRTDSFSSERKLELSKWDFARWDSNNDGLWFSQEFNKIIDSLIYIEPCIY